MHAARVVRLEAADPERTVDHEGVENRRQQRLLAPEPFARGQRQRVDGVVARAQDTISVNQSQGRRRRGPMLVARPHIGTDNPLSFLIQDAIARRTKRLVPIAFDLGRVLAPQHLP